MTKQIQYVQVHFMLNDQVQHVTAPPEQTLLQYLHETVRLTGTKESCSEGDCGACTVALGSWESGSFVYRAVNSCIIPLSKVHGKHVVTVEGLGTPDQLHPIQRAMYEEHATQCGYCTPGFIMSLFCLFAMNPEPEKEDVLSALEGNLCRCTGYESIYRAVDHIKSWKREHPGVGGFIPASFLALQDYLKDSVEGYKHGKHTVKSDEEVQGYYRPSSLQELFTLLRHFENPKDYKLIAGGTDVMVEMNVRRIFHRNYIDLTFIPELDRMDVEGDHIRIGAGVSYARIMERDLIQDKLPLLGTVFSQMASKQIRNIGTLVGNIANASPVGDAASVLLGMNSSVELLSSEGVRVIPLEEFYQGYKVTALKEREIIGAVLVPIQKGVCSFEKTAKRIAVDISTINSYVQYELEDGIFRSLRMSFGGIAESPKLAKSAQAYLLGKKADADTIREAIHLAVSEFMPISDVRGSAAYRRLLIRNHLIKHFASFLVSGGEV